MEVTNKTALVMVHRLENVMRAIGSWSSGSPNGWDGGAKRRRVRWRHSARSATQGFGAAAEIADGNDRDDVPWARPSSAPNRQFLAFVETARELGYSEDAEKFDAVLREIGRQPPPPSRQEMAVRNRAAMEEPVALQCGPGGPDADGTVRGFA